MADRVVFDAWAVTVDGEIRRDHGSDRAMLFTSSNAKTYAESVAKDRNGSAVRVRVTVEIIEKGGEGE